MPSVEHEVTGGGGLWPRKEEKLLGCGDPAWGTEEQMSVANVLMLCSRVACMASQMLPVTTLKNSETYLPPLMTFSDTDIECVQDGA